MAKDEADQAAGGRGYHHGGLRGALIDAARDVIRSNGVEQFSVQKCADRLKVSSAAPYKHFKSKEELLAAVSADGFLRLAAEFRTALEGRSEGSDEALVALGQSYVRFVSSNPELFHLMWGSTRQKFDSDLAMPSGLECFEVFETAVCAVRSRRGLDHVPLVNLIVPLWSSVHGLASLLIGEKLSIVDDVDLDAMVDRSTRAFLLGLSALPTTPAAPDSGWVVC